MGVGVDDGDIYVERIGMGPPMLVVGGIHLSHDYLRPWLDPLADHARLLFVDHRGTGGSEATGSASRLDGLDHGRWAEDLESVRREMVDGRTLLFGHSYGGFIALEYAVRHSDRLAGLVLSNTAPIFDFQEVVMANAAARGGARELSALQRVFSREVSEDAELASLWQRILPLYFHEWDGSAARRMNEGTSYSAAAFDRAYGSCLPEYDVRGRLSEVCCPTLVLDGADDWIMPPAYAGARLVEGLPDADRVVFEASGHFPFVEETDRFLEVISGWIRERAATVVSPDVDATGASR